MRTGLSSARAQSAGTLALVAMTLLVAGCGKQADTLDQQRTAELGPMASEPPAAFYEPALGQNAKVIQPGLLEIRPDYRLKPFDQIEIMYSVRIDPRDRQTIVPTEIEKFDEITVRFLSDSQKHLSSEKIVVGEDGTLRLPLIGEVRCMAKTPGALEAELVERYAKFVKSPQLVVQLNPKNQVVSDLIEAIKTSPRGSSRLVPVRPDGKVSALLLPREIDAAGRTVREVQRDLNDEYSRLLDGIQVTVQLLEVAPDRVFVMGEVSRPGQIDTQRGLTIIQAASLAGGFTSRADLSKVILIRRKSMAVPQGVLVDVASIQAAKTVTPSGDVPDFAMYRYDVYLVDGDILFVPPSGIAKFNDWVDLVFTKGIRQIIPYSLNFGVNWTGQLGEFRNVNVEENNRGPTPVNFRFGG